MTELSEDESLVLKVITDGGNCGIHHRDVLNQVRILIRETDDERKFQDKELKEILETLVEHQMIHVEVVHNEKRTMRKTCWALKNYEMYCRKTSLSDRGFGLDHQTAVQHINLAGAIGLNFSQMKQVMNGTQTFSDEKLKEIIDDLVRLGEIFQSTDENLIIYVDKEHFNERNEMSQAEINN